MDFTPRLHRLWSPVHIANFVMRSIITSLHGLAMKTGLFLLMFYCSFLSIPYSYPAKSWDDESCSPPILIGLWGYMPRCVFKSFTHKDGWKLNYWRKASDGRGGGGEGTPELDRQVQSTLILSCCRMFWGLEFSIPGVFLGRKFGKFFWFLYLCWNVFEGCCSHTATTRVYMPGA